MQIKQLHTRAPIILASAQLHTEKRSYSNKRTYSHFQINTHTYTNNQQAVHLNQLFDRLFCFRWQHHPILHG